uniref:Uncharacterized protein n=1 Tax=Opuntia streptacantha TaxID=393608 RepID=A0A7C9B5L7_OPUST
MSRVVFSWSCRGSINILLWPFQCFITLIHVDIWLNITKPGTSPSHRYRLNNRSLMKCRASIISGHLTGPSLGSNLITECCKCRIHLRKHPMHCIPKLMCSAYNASSIIIISIISLCIAQNKINILQKSRTCYVMPRVHTLQQCRNVHRILDYRAIVRGIFIGDRIMESTETLII